MWLRRVKNLTMVYIEVESLKIKDRFCTSLLYWIPRSTEGSGSLNKALFSLLLLLTVIFISCNYLSTLFFLHSIFSRKNQWAYMNVTMKSISTRWNVKERKIYVILSQVFFATFLIHSVMYTCNVQQRRWLQQTVQLRNHIEQTNPYLCFLWKFQTQLWRHRNEMRKVKSKWCKVASEQNRRHTKNRPVQYVHLICRAVVHSRTNWGLQPIVINCTTMLYSRWRRTSEAPLS